jgi:hypothetical protein
MYKALPRLRGNGAFPGLRRSFSTSLIVFNPALISAMFLRLADFTSRQHRQPDGVTQRGGFAYTVGEVVYAKKGADIGRYAQVLQIFLKY